MVSSLFVDTLLSGSQETSRTLGTVGVSSVFSTLVPSIKTFRVKREGPDTCPV